MSLLDIKKEELKFLTDEGKDEYDRQLTEFEDLIPDTSVMGPNCNNNDCDSDHHGHSLTPDI